MSEPPEYGSAELAASLRAGDWGLPDPSVHGHGGHHGEGGPAAGGLTSVRTAHHKGHEIRIETTYNVTIDGRKLDTGLEVLDNGTVHYHGLPQYAVPSAVELVKRIIDYFGTEPPADDELGRMEAQ